MMRSLFSGVAGLRTHQVKMDVIGNNIANVNTVAYKSQNITFQDLMYQNSRRASAANVETGVGGINSSQTGLGVKVGAINTNITLSGAMQTTNLPFDIAITGNSFFVVSNGQENFFTRAGSFYVDGVGNLAMTTTGYNVMGWLPYDAAEGNPNTIKKDTVQALKIMSDEYMTYPAEATTRATIAGIVDKNDADINSTVGKFMNLEFYDEQGNKYTARLAMHNLNGDAGEFYVRLDDILDSNAVSMKGTPAWLDVEFGSKLELAVRQSQIPIRRTGELPVNIAQSIFFSTGGATPAALGNTVVNQSIAVPAAATAGQLTAAEIGAIYDTAPSTTVRDRAAAPGSTYIVSPNGTITITNNTLSPASMSYQVPAGVAPAEDANGSRVNAVAVTANGSTVTIPNTLALPVQFTADGNGVITDPTATGTPPVGILGPDPAATIINMYGIDLTGVLAFEIDAKGSVIVTQIEVENATRVNYSPANGTFIGVGGGNSPSMEIRFNTNNPVLAAFQTIELDFSTTLQSNNNKKSTVGATRGGVGEYKGIGTGRMLGEMLGVVVQKDGMIYANYSNGQSRLLGQIATASFANASGLEKVGDNLYSATMNSGEFDGIGEDITANGGYMSTGVLEMSNVDLSAEFTEMITTQRGFQANSRIITVSDSLLEELTNLKR